MKAKENGDYSLIFQSGQQKEIKINNIPKPIVIENNWQVKFDKYYDFDSTFIFNKLIDWKDHESEEVRNYSGTTSYSTSINISKDLIDKNIKLELNLGEVSIAARVFVNGNELGVLWKSPFNVDITSVVQSGENKLVIEVTNTWTNRLIGDEKHPNLTGYERTMEDMPEWYTNNEKPNLGKRKAFCAFPFYKSTDSLMPSGLKGPVTLHISKFININNY